MKTNRPDTPCIAICSTALGDDVCKGCVRTFAEISQWCFMGEDEKDRVWARLDDRKKLFNLGRLCGASLVRILEEEGAEWGEFVIASGNRFTAGIQDRCYVLNFAGQMDIQVSILAMLKLVIESNQIKVLNEW